MHRSTRPLRAFLLAALLLLALPAIAGATTVKTYVYGGGTIEVFKHASWDLQYKCDPGRLNPTGTLGATCDRDGFLLSNRVYASARAYAGYRFVGYAAPGNTCVGETGELCTATAWGAGTMTLHAYFVDDTPPETHVLSRPPVRTRSRSADMVLGSDQEGVTFECHLDSEPWHACGREIPMRNLTDGLHRIEARATDPSGNRDESIAVYEWTVDATGPVVSMAGSPPYVSRGQVERRFATEAGAELQCALDTPTAPAYGFAPCSSPKVIAPLAEGRHALHVRGVDDLGNIGGVVTSEWINDTLAPRVDITSGPDAEQLLRTRDVPFRFLVTEPNPRTATCRLDDEVVPCAPTIANTLANLGDGRHRLTITAVDAVGHATTIERHFRVDATPPTTTITAGPAAGADVTARTAVFTFTTSEPGQSACQLDGGTWLTCTSPHEVRGLGLGVHTLRILSSDAAGNVPSFAEATSRTWKVVEPPVVIVPEDSKPVDPEPVDPEPEPPAQLPTPIAPVPAAPSAGAAAPDRTAPGFTATAAKSVRLGRASVVAIRVRCTEACTVTGFGTARRGTLGTRVVTPKLVLRIDTTSVLRVIVPAKVRAQLARGTGSLRVTLVARDAAGNQSLRAVVVQLRR